MRKVPALFMLSALVASVTGSMQACSSGDGAADLGNQDAGPSQDATVADATPDVGSTSSSSSSSSGEPKNTKPADGGIDLGNLGPGEHVLDIGNCPAFAACGGAIDGKAYTYSGGCFDEDGLERSLREQSSCDDIDVYDSRAVVSGHFDFNAESQYDRELKLRFSGNILIPGSCSFLAFLGGCDGLSQQLSGFGFSGLTCYDPEVGEGCDCVINTERTEAALGGYSVAAGPNDAGATEIVLEGADGGKTTVPYCVAAATMKHQQRQAKESIADPGAYMTWNMEESAQ